MKIITFFWWFACLLSPLQAALSGGEFYEDCSEEDRMLFLRVAYMIDVSYTLSENPQELTQNLKDRLPSDIQVVSASSPEEKPFNYSVFYEKEKNIYYLILDGTNFYTSDLLDDIKIIANEVPKQMTQASAKLDALVKQHPDARFVVAGHSLGGSLAQYAMIKSSSDSIRCMTYNGLGLPKKFMAETRVRFGERVTHIVHDDDVVKSFSIWKSVTSFNPGHLPGRVVRIDSKAVASCYQEAQNQTSNKNIEKEKIDPSSFAMHNGISRLPSSQEADLFAETNTFMRSRTLLRFVESSGKKIGGNIVWKMAAEVAYKVGYALGEGFFAPIFQHHRIQKMIDTMKNTQSYLRVLQEIEQQEASPANKGGDPSYRFHVGIPRERLDSLKNIHSRKDISAYFKKDEILGHEAWQIAQSGADLTSGMLQYHQETEAIGKERERVIKEILKNNCYDSLELYIDLTIPTSFCAEYQKKTNTKWFQELMEIHDQMVNQLASVVDIGSAEKAVAQLEVLSEKMAMKKSSSRLGLGTTMSLDIQIRKFANQIIQAGLERFDRQKVRIMESNYYGSTKLKELLRTGGALNRISLFADDYMQQD